MDNVKNGQSKFPKLDFKAPTMASTTSGRKNALDLLAIAIRKGTTKDASLSAETKTFVNGRAAYNAAKAEGKIPVCAIKGSTCSNEHFTLTQKNGAKVPVCVTIGRIMQRLASGETWAKIAKEYEASAS